MKKEDEFNRFTSNDNFKLVPSVFVVVWGVFMLFNIALFGAIIYVAYHFITKFW
jgi:hypothetical protein